MLLVAVFRNDGNLANAPFQSAIVFRFVKLVRIRKAVTWHIYCLVRKMIVDDDGNITPFRVVDQNRTNGTGVVCVTRDACDFVTVGRRVKRNDATPSRPTGLHLKTFRRHVAH